MKVADEYWTKPHQDNERSTVETIMNDQRWKRDRSVGNIWCHDLFMRDYENLGHMFHEVGTLRPILFTDPDHGYEKKNII